MPTDTAAVPDIRPLVDQVLADALRRRASDVHFEPTAGGYDLRFRVDGLLQIQRQLDTVSGRAAVARLMVMAKLLTYRLDVPQEGRVTFHAAQSDTGIELRLAVMPTVQGLRAAVRLPADQLQAAVLDELDLPDPVVAGLKKFAAADSGMLILVGPAGSGKTTTIYALLSQIVQAGAGISVIALEDPVERHLAGVTQIEVSPFGQLTYERALRSILRQDPQVLMLGEIRDAATATLAVQAALSGHRLITTLHAATCGGAISRLLEMGIEPYQLSSSLWGIVSQRLIRRREPDGQYHGRIPLAEIVLMDGPMRKAILQHADSDTLRKIYCVQPGFRPLADIGQALLDKGVTDQAELHRVIDVPADIE
ncbi:MAG: ATPase, T2SS/T4P/T4SS family [Tepidisphaeraceae bacterium]|jgi:type II secretory ATPase GspE/PulE/Tfp pilus assembly ATPase PilB-like protein